MNLYCISIPTKYHASWEANKQMIIRHYLKGGHLHRCLIDGKNGPFQRISYTAVLPESKNKTKLGSKEISDIIR